MSQNRAATRPRRTGGGRLPTGTVTFLFTDIEGSTALLREAGTAYGALLDEHRRLLRAAFTAHSGHEVDTQGDSFFVAFAGPAQAAAAAADAQRALASHPWAPECRVRVRMGLHTGEASTVGSSYVSLAVHRAARIAAAAHGGQVLLSEATAVLVRDELPEGATLHDLGEHRLKDFEAPTRLFQLALPGLPSRFPPPRTLGRRSPLPVAAGPFVGRDRDLDALTTLLRDSTSRLITLTGPGGIGKTRLAVEAAHAVSADFAGGAVFLPLAAVTDSRLVLGAIADALGTHPEPGVDVHEAVGALVGEDRTLLVVDNVEQVLGAAAPGGVAGPCAGARRPRHQPLGPAAALGAALPGAPTSGARRGAPVPRAGGGGSAGVLPGRRGAGRGAGDLPSTGRRALGHRARHGPTAAAAAVSAAGPVGRPPRRARHRTGGPPRTAAHAPCHGGLEP